MSSEIDLKREVLKYWLAGHWDDDLRTYVATIDALNVTAFGPTVEISARAAYDAGSVVLEEYLAKGLPLPPSSLHSKTKQ